MTAFRRLCAVQTTTSLLTRHNCACMWTLPTLTLNPGEQDEPAINYDELEALFQIMESSALRKLTKARAEEIRLIEHRRAHNISIELSGIRKPYADIRVSFSLNMKACVA